MELNTITKTLSTLFSFKKVKENEFHIYTFGMYPNKTPIVLFLEQVKNGWVLSDKKQTLKFMNTIYELKAPEVRSSINSILRAYGLKLQNGMIYIEIANEKNLANRIFDFIMCIGQLSNMYVFFESPEK